MTQSRQGPVTDTVLQLRDVSVTFDMDRGVSRVLNDVDLNVERGEILGIVGESGSGKSMLASSLLDAVVEPGQLSGNISYYPENGEEIDILDLSKRELKQMRWEEISMVFQGAMSSFNPTQNIKVHFIETLDAHNVEREVGLNRAREILTDLHLSPDRIFKSYPHELSGGMKQRALIALSLVLEPEVLVMDEPTAALDLLMQRSILTLLDDIQSRTDITLIFITHDLPLVAHLADRLAVLYAFEIVEIGRAKKIVEESSHPYTRALLKATPNIDAPLEQMRPIQGNSPDPVNVPEGCSYHPRCPLADEICTEVDPKRETISPTEEVACHYWEDAAQAIQFNTHDDLQGGE